MGWVKLCRQAVSGEEIGGEMYNLAGRWWGNVSRDESIELDVVAESLDRKKLLVGECKWTEGEDADRLIYELTRGCNLNCVSKANKKSINFANTVFL